MYVIHRNNKRYNKLSFATYEHARKYAIRSIRKIWRKERGFSIPWYPALSDVGMKVVRKAA